MTISLPGGLTEEEMLNLPAPAPELLDLGDNFSQQPSPFSTTERRAPPPAPARKSSIKQPSAEDRRDSNGHMMSEVKCCDCWNLCCSKNILTSKRDVFVDTLVSFAANTMQQASCYCLLPRLSVSVCYWIDSDLFQSHRFTCIPVCFSLFPRESKNCSFQTLSLQKRCKKILNEYFRYFRASL